MFDAHKNDVSNAKIIVTTTTISNVSIYIFSNYNENEIKKMNAIYLISQKFSTKNVDRFKL